MKKIILNALLLTLSMSAFSQTNIERCSTMEVDALLRANNPSLGTLDDFEEWLAPKVVAYKNQQNKSGAKKTVYNIPVIIHIIHNSNESVGQERNISYAQAISQIDVLNEDFRKQNGDFSSTPAVFQNVAADCEINFCLATVDPNGNTLSEVGVNRISATSISGVSNTSSTNIADGYTSAYFNANVKPTTQWDPDKYLNMWVAHMGSTGSGQLLGYAQFPNSSGLPGSLANEPANTDGVVMLYKAFGNTGNLLPDFPLGRTATHEVGHWLGLRHIWGDANCGDDFCNDTPTQAGDNSGCPTHPTPTCTNSGDMFVNFMDYCDDACLTMFTEDQKARMVTVMQNSPRRGVLNSSDVCSGGFVCESEQNFSDTDTPSTYPDTDGSPGWGWISGHNSWDDRAKVEKFTQSVDGEIRSVEIAFSKAHDGNSGGTVAVKVWSESGGLPMNVLASETITISALTTGISNMTSVTFSTPIQITGPATYFIGVEFSANTNDASQDSIAIYSNADGETAVATAYEMWFDGTWHSMGSANAWNKQISLIIMPEVCLSTVGVEDNSSLNDQLLVYPNPTSGNINIIINEATKGQIEVFNLLGEIVLSQKVDGKESTVYLGNQPNGIYLIKVETPKGAITKKILLSK
ncbi:M43 family zinc metalloprotease [Vicingaceae bacterium]|nr:M43 family zinc metalloprotease [Vicingaceae bacterium]